MFNSCLESGSWAVSIFSKEQLFMETPKIETKRAYLRNL
ncbi:hypothetical protein D778_01051 [Xanthomarina gelatinilytica]|uniref:Uncharacterized protein n=1 Tax=Xanthomarina gelatinilytica TaxID=1137281 RepID=M7N494_9FLAO|nr:hypothetical protein D778_01051 [Xanthomarina gelatinilytica]